jgi:putative inorganic carbon (HCO3(-)) transporter
MLLVSLYATFDLAFSAPRVVSIVYGIAVFYAAAAFAGRSQRHLFWGVAALLLCGLIVAIISLLGTQWTAKLPFLPGITDRLPQLIRPEAAPAGFSPNQVAGTLLWVLPVFIVLTVFGLSETRFLRSGTAKLRWAVLLVGIGFLVVLGTFLLTQSRGGFLGLAVGLLFMALAARSSRPVVLIATVLVILLLLVSLWALPLSEWLVGAIPVTETDLSGEALDSFPLGEETIGRRVEIWSRALYGLEDFPFTGMGVGTFRRVVPVLYPLFLVGPESDIAHAHNHLLQTGLDLGLPGLIAYVALWLLAGAMLWRSWHLRQDSWQGALVIGFAGVLIGYFVYGMSDTVALGAKPGFIFWLLLGLIAGMHHWLSQSRRTAN